MLGFLRFLDLKRSSGYGDAARIILRDAALVIGYRRHRNTVAKAGHTKTRRCELSPNGIDIDPIRSCLDSNFALYC